MLIETKIKRVLYKRSGAVGRSKRYCGLCERFAIQSEDVIQNIPATPANAIRRIPGQSTHVGYHRSL